MLSIFGLWRSPGNLKWMSVVFQMSFKSSKHSGFGFVFVGDVGS